MNVTTKNRVFFTSDTHFNHANIIKYTNRPWKDLDEMNEALIKNWNEVVGPDDVVWHLGDFAMGPKIHHRSFFERLNGYKRLVRGNHDQSSAKMLYMGWFDVYLTTPLYIENQRLWLTHMPPRQYDPYAGRTYPTEFEQVLSQPPTGFDYVLCGHVHEAWKRQGNVINVGVDVRGYRPVSLKQLLEESP